MKITSYTAASALALFLALSAGPAWGQEPGPLDGFDAYVSGAVEAWDAVGLSVVVEEDDRVVFEEGYGVRTLGRGEPVDAHTLFASASAPAGLPGARLAARGRRVE